MSAAEKTTGEAGEQSWDLSFLAVELKESASLGGDVRVEFAPRTTVLVGKNGAGKSLLLEKMYAAVGGAAGFLRTSESDPGYFACEVEDRSQPSEGEALKLHYECRWHLRDENQEAVDALHFTDEVHFKVEESCWISGDTGSPLWHVDDGLVTYQDGKRGEVAAGTTLLNWSISRHDRGALLFPAPAYPLRKLFFGVTPVPAGIPRGDTERRAFALPYPRRVRNSDRIHRLAYRLVDWHRSLGECFDEFVELGRRIGLFNQVKVKFYIDPDASGTAQRQDFASIHFDGTDFGLLSDGTLRVVEILLCLVFPDVKLLLIEEPETAVHPGLLAKLLAEIEAYSDDRQIILSTQSPNLVSWADPRAIRLVERHTGKTTVRSLREDEISRVSAYLHDEGTLGDFVYSGALDG